MLVTWLCQWITDVYLITFPVVCAVFATIAALNVFWYGGRDYGELDVTDNPTVNDCYEFLDESMLPLWLNCALVAITAGIN